VVVRGQRSRSSGSSDDHTDEAGGSLERVGTRMASDGRRGAAPTIGRWAGDRVGWAACRIGAGLHHDMTTGASRRSGGGLK